MFCPLCKAEFRQGFTTCSDCHISLVATQEEANAVAVGRLWIGGSQRTLDRILKALDGQSIPSRFKEIVNVRPQVSVLGIPITPIRSTFEYEVWVFRSDLENGRQAIQDVR
jgi:hypothetical protein